jgi:parallel beta-helix repeat protein
VAGHNSRVRLNATHGNGYSEPADDFGIGVIGTASGNVIDQNNITGNTNGIYLGAGTRQTMVRQNIVLGNPAIQIANANPNAPAADILNLSAAGQTTFERNTCITSVNAPCPAISSTPPQ